MARPDTEGLGYFPLDVEYFDSIELMTIFEEHGAIGELVAVKLTAWIFRQGYAVDWDERTAKIFARRVMLDSALDVQAIVNSLLDVGYLDRPTYERTGKLTSRGIQKRWVAARRHCHKSESIEPNIDLVNKVAEGSHEDCAKSSEDFAKSLEDCAKSPEDCAKPLEKCAVNKIREDKRRLDNTPLTPHEGGRGCAAEKNPFDDEFGDLSTDLQEYSGQVIAVWNESFRGTAREANPVNTPLYPKYRENLARASDNGITIAQFRAAFRSLKAGGKFSWPIHSAVKPENVQILLAEAENSKKTARSGPKQRNSRSVYEVTGEETYDKNAWEVAQCK